MDPFGVEFSLYFKKNQSKNLVGLKHRARAINQTRDTVQTSLYDHFCDDTWLNQLYRLPLRDAILTVCTLIVWRSNGAGTSLCKCYICHSVYRMTVVSISFLVICLLYKLYKHGDDWKCETGKCGTVKNAGVQNARRENAAPDCKGGKCGTIEHGKLVCE